MVEESSSSPPPAAPMLRRKLLLSGAALLLVAAIALAVAVPISAQRQAQVAAPSSSAKPAALQGATTPSAPNGSTSSSTGAPPAAAASSTASNAMSRGISSSGTAESSTVSSATSCNSVAGLCSAPVRQVIFPGTHNSNAIKPSLFLAESQKLSFKQQLQAGVRLFDLDYVGSEQGSRFAHCFSCFCSFAADPADADPAKVFAAMAEFLAANPREVIVIGLSNIECGDKAAARQSLLGTLAASPLQAYLATQVVGPATTLGQLVQSNQRAVLLFYDAWTSADGWKVGSKAVPDQPLFRIYGEDISVGNGASDAAAVDAQVASRLTQGISSQFLAKPPSPDTTWRVLGLFPSTCIVCRTPGQCGSMACSVKANSQPYVTYLLGNITARWLMPQGSQQQQPFVPAFNGLQVDQVQLPAASGGKGLVAAAERLNRALAWLYVMKPQAAAKLGLGNCVWVLDDAAHAGGLACVHHARVSIAALLEVAASSAAGSRRLLVPANGKLRVQVFAGSQVQQTVAGKDGLMQLVDIPGTADAVQVLWP